jgi:4-amino-4-deoxy-L-arabinose transferase-like glycosyltransferase
VTEPVFAALLFVLAFVPRLVVALRFDSEPVWDGHYYDFGARRIADGFGYSDDLPVDGVSTWHPWCHYPVGYSGFLAAFYRLFGATTHTAAVVNALVGALLAVVTFGLAAGLTSTGRARIAGLLVALHPGLVLYSALVMSEPLAAVLTLFAFVCASRSREPMRGAALGAIVLGISALVRPQALLCAPFLAWRLFPGRIPAKLGKHALRGAARALALFAVLGCLVLAPVLPWTARNCKVMDGCALVSTNAGWNLAIGAFPRATGRFETLRSSDGCREVSGQVQQDRCWLHYGLAQIREHPGHWLALVPAKLGFTFDHESFPVEYLHEARPQVWSEERRAKMRELLTLVHRILLSLAGFGAVAWATKRSPLSARITQAVLALVVVSLVAWGFTAGTPIFWPLAVFLSIVPWLPLPGRPPLPPGLAMALSLLATTALAHAVFFGEDRYHLVATPVLCILAAAMFRRPQSERPWVWSVSES